LGIVRCAIINNVGNSSQLSTIPHTNTIYYTRVFTCLRLSGVFKRILRHFGGFLVLLTSMAYFIPFVVVGTEILVGVLREFRNTIYYTRVFTCLELSGVFKLILRHFGGFLVFLTSMAYFTLFVVVGTGILVGVLCLNLGTLFIVRQCSLAYSLGTFSRSSFAILLVSLFS